MSQVVPCRARQITRENTIFLFAASGSLVGLLLWEDRAQASQEILLCLGLSVGQSGHKTWFELTEMAEFGFTFHLLLSSSLLKQVSATLLIFFLLRSMKEAKCDLPNMV